MGELIFVFGLWECRFVGCVCVCPGWTTFLLFADVHGDFSRAHYEDGVEENGK